MNLMPPSVNAKRLTDINPVPTASREALPLGGFSSPEGDAILAVRIRAETVTVLLEEILNSHRPMLLQN